MNTHDLGKVQLNDHVMFLVNITLPSIVLDTSWNAILCIICRQFQKKILVTAEFI